MNHYAEGLPVSVSRENMQTLNAQICVNGDIMCQALQFYWKQLKKTLNYGKIFSI